MKDKRASIDFKKFEKDFEESNRIKKNLMILPKISRNTKSITGEQPELSKLYMSREEPFFHLEPCKKRKKSNKKIHLL